MDEQEVTTSGQGTSFDLAEIEAALRTEDAYLREGHTARTLVRERDLRVVLVALRAGARMAEHRANDTASIHTIRGHLRLQLPDKLVDLPMGSLLVLERGVRHDVEAISDSALLLTLGWQKQ